MVRTIWGGQVVVGEEGSGGRGGGGEGGEGCFGHLDMLPTINQMVRI